MSSKWEVHVHVDDEEDARNLTEELNNDGYGATLYKREVREKSEMVLQYALLPKQKEVSGRGIGA